MFREILAAAPDLGIEIQSLEVLEPVPDFEGAFEAAAKAGAGAMLVLRDPLTIKYQDQITSLAAEIRLPAMYETRDFIDAGGLMLYGPSLEDLYRNAATFADKILKGANPADMPVEHPTMFELVVNQKAADVMGLTFPESFLLQATEVIR